MRVSTAASISLSLSIAMSAGAQPPGKWPPDSLVNTQVIPRATSPTQVWGQMRTIGFSLGVECTFCHVGHDKAPLAQIDFASDEKRNKLVARYMMRMTQDINKRLDSMPSGQTVTVTCATCHRGVSLPIPLSTIITDVAVANGADSALRSYRAMRALYYGRDAYDFAEPTLNTAAFRTARAGKVEDGLALTRYNEKLFPKAVQLHIIRGNIYLMKNDTSAAAESFRRALKRDPANEEALGRLASIGRGR